MEKILEELKKQEAKLDELSLQVKNYQELNQQLIKQNNNLWDKFQDTLSKKNENGSRVGGGIEVKIENDDIIIFGNTYTAKNIIKEVGLQYGGAKFENKNGDPKWIIANKEDALAALRLKFQEYSLPFVIHVE